MLPLIPELLESRPIRGMNYMENTDTENKEKAVMEAKSSQVLSVLPFFCHDSFADSFAQDEITSVSLAFA